MRILVIGGSGFIGIPLVKKLSAAGYEVVVAARGKKKFPVLNDNISFVPINRKDGQKFSRIFSRQRFAAIYDLMAFAPRDVMNIAATFPYSLRYIMVSSIAVYGIPHTVTPLREDAPKTPIEWHDYGRNKLLTEQETENNSTFHWCIVRPATVYGPQDPHEPRASHFFYRIFQQIPLLIPGYPNVHNNYIYVDDLADLLFACLNAPATSILNVGGPSFTWIQYLQTLAKIMNSRLPPCKFLQLSLEQFRHWQHCKKLQFHHNAFYDLVLDSTRAQQLGWYPRHSLAQGLKKTWQWLRDSRLSKLVDKQPDLQWERELWSLME